HMAVGRRSWPSLRYRRSAPGEFPLMGKPRNRPPHRVREPERRGRGGERDAERLDRRSRLAECARGSAIDDAVPTVRYGRSSAHRNRAGEQRDFPRTKQSVVTKGFDRRSPNHAEPFEPHATGGIMQTRTMHTRSSVSLISLALL